MTSTNFCAAFTAALPLGTSINHGLQPPGRRARALPAIRVSATSRRRGAVVQMSAFKLPDGTPSSDILIATARAITPLRGHEETFEESALPSQRSADLMAPRSGGIMGALPYVALYASVCFAGWIGWKRLRARQQRLVAEYGEVAVYYGTTPDAARQITSEYKRKLGPGILRPALFKSFLRALVTEKPVGPGAIQDASLVKRLLRIGDKTAVTVVNELGAELKTSSPSLLGKLLFIAERTFKPTQVAALRLTSLFPYSATTVLELQRNMAERCYKELVEREIDEHGAQEPPLDMASVLKIDLEVAHRVFDSVVEEREAVRKKAEAEAVVVAEAEVTQAKPTISDELDYPARSGEPAKVTVHAYQCTVCGYTMYPAAGREFKFYGPDFVCPACGAPKSKFVDISSNESNE